MTDISKKRAGKALKYTLSALWYCMVILLALTLVWVIGAKIKGEVPKIAGYSVMRITTGSMEPDIMTGDYIIVKEVPQEQVKKGDIISFYSEDMAIYGLPNTHRVVEDPIVKDGKIEFVTKGSANPANDKINAKGDRLIGVYVKKLDFITSLSHAFEGNGMIVLIVFVQLMFIALVVMSFVIKKNQIKADSADGTNGSDGIDSTGGMDKDRKAVDAQDEKDIE